MDFTIDLWSNIVLELTRLEESGDLNRDNEVSEYIEKIATHRKRLDLLNKNLLYIQARVDKIESRYIAFKKTTFEKWGIFAI